MAIGGLLSTRASDAQIRAPFWLIWIAVATTVLGVLAIYPGTGSTAWAIGGYALSALVTPGITVLYRFGRRRAARSPWYIPSTSANRLMLVTLTIGILAGGINAWLIATELAKH